MKLQDRVVLITGAAGGIGQSLASTLSAAGANLILHYNSNKDGALALSKSLSTEHILVQADLTDEAQVLSLFAAAKRRFGRIDYLIANAARYNPSNIPVSDLTLVQWNQCFSTNTTSVFLCVREYLKLIKETHAEGMAHAGISPSIVLMGSTAGVIGEANHADYAASKSALIYGFTKSVKNEIVKIHPRARVNVISPGWTLTPMAKEKLKDPSAVKKVLQTIALQKLCTPADVAKTALYLLNEEYSGHMSGENLVLSGGMEGRVLFEKDEVAFNL